nr:hypothetical protein [uncultured organism]
MKPLVPNIIGTDPVQPPEETAFDLSSDGKPTMIKGDQANTISNASLAVGQSESSAVGTPLSEKSVSSFPQNNLEEKLNQKQQTDQSSTRSFKDDSIEASGTASPNTLATSGDIQPSPLKESMQEPEGSRKQQQADRAVFQSKRDNKTQIEETETQDTGFDEPKEIRSDSAPISGDGPATGSVRDSQAPPPAGTQNVPTVFSEKISPRPLLTDPAPAMTPMTSSATAPDAPQGTDLCNHC